MNLGAQFVGQHLPAIPVALVHAVFNGDNRVSLTQTCQVIGKTLGIEALAFAGQLVLAILVEFGRRTVQGEGHIGTKLVTGLLDRFLDNRQRRFVGGQVGSKTTLITDRCVQALGLKHFFQAVKNLRANTQGFREALGGNRLNHELLDINVVIRVLTTVQNVHHRHRHGKLAGGAIDVGNVRIQRLAQGDCRCLGRSKGNRQNCIGAQVRLVLGTVEVQHDLIQSTLISCIFAYQCITDLAVHGFHSLQNTFAKVAGGVTVTQFQRFAGTGRRT